MAKRILTVDDSASMRQMALFTLQGAGYEVLQACDGVEALELARGTTVELVLTDVHMPRMDGITLVRELRALPAYKFVPMLILTTESKDNGRDLRLKMRDFARETNVEYIPGYRAGLFMRPMVDQLAGKIRDVIEAAEKTELESRT